MNTDSSRGIDDVTFGLSLLLLSITILAMTAVAVTVVAVVVAINWFFGKPTIVATIAAIAGTGLLALQAFVPGLHQFVATALNDYQIALRAPAYLAALFDAWLKFAADTDAWLRLGPVGLLLGSAAVAILESRRQSPLNAVFGHRPRRPAPWATIRAARVLRGPLIHNGEVVIGADKFTGEQITLSRSQLATHVFLLGRSGRGKTVTAMALCRGLAEIGTPILYIDGKGEKAAEQILKLSAAECGVPFYCVDTSNPNDSCAWHVTSDMNATTASEVFKRLREYTEPHYEARAARYALITCRVLRHVGIIIDPFSFKTNLPVANQLALLRQNFKKGDDVARRLMEEVRSLREIEADAIDSLRPEIDRITESDFGYLFDVQRAIREQRPILRLLQARRERAVVYVNLPALDYPEMAPKIANFGISGLKAILPTLDREHAATTNDPLPLAEKQFFCVLDEGSVTASSENCKALINQGRSFGAAICISTQSEADFIIDGSDKLLRQLVASCGNFIIHELNEPADAEHVAGIFGTRNTTEFTAQTVGGSPTGAASARATNSYAAHPDSIKNLGIGEALYLDKNAKDKRTGQALARIIRVRKAIP